MKVFSHRYFSIQGISIKHLHERWRVFKFDPKAKHIEVFITDVKQTVHLFNHNDIAVLNLIKACMPADIYCTLYQVQELDMAVSMVKDIYAIKPEP